VRHLAGARVRSHARAVEPVCGGAKADRRDGAEARERRRLRGAAGREGDARGGTGSAAALLAGVRVRQVKCAPPSSGALAVSFVHARMAPPAETDGDGDVQNHR